MLQCSITRLTFILLIAVFCPLPSAAQNKPRARDLGIPFQGTPGPLDAITDVDGVTVGFTTLVSGEGKLIMGQGPVRTGVTAVFPRGARSDTPAFGGWFSLNGNGEMTGTTWLEESGILAGPIMITNTHSVGVVRDSVIAWLVKNHRMKTDWLLPIVAETWDGWLNDLNGFHVHQDDVFHAMDTAHSGRVEEGNVGGGTGMICYEFKGGTGTASRRLDAKDGGYTVGVLVQCNCGRRSQLTIAGVPVGREMPEHPAYGDAGSIIIVIATDAPLLPHQLKRLARRASLGLARTGSTSGNGSGDIFVAFATANPDSGKTAGLANLTMIPNDHMGPLFDATVQAAEEAIVNTLVAAETMTGIDNHTVIALPHDRLQEVLKKYNSLVEVRPKQ